MMKKVSTYPGADIDPDNNLVATEVELKFKKSKQKSVDMSKLELEIKSKV